MHLPASDLTGVAWRRSNHSGAQGNCVELASVRVDGRARVALRNSRVPDGAALVLTRDDIAGLLTDARAGRLDEPAATSR